MAENPDRGHEDAPGRPKGGEQGTQGGRLRELSAIVAAVSAGVLIGGGIGLLVGVVLGVFNPFALGVIGIAVGVGVSVPLMRRMFGG